MVDCVVAGMTAGIVKEMIGGDLPFVVSTIEWTMDPVRAMELRRIEAFFLLLIVFRVVSKLVG